MTKQIIFYISLALAILGIFIYLHIVVPRIFVLVAGLTGLLGFSAWVASFFDGGKQ